MTKKLIEDKKKRNPAKTVFEKEVQMGAMRITDLINSIDENNQGLKGEIEDTVMAMDDLHKTKLKIS